MSEMKFISLNYVRQEQNWGESRRKLVPTSEAVLLSLTTDDAKCE
jgi:hypothetical protein